MIRRPRRLRRNNVIRNLVRENHVRLEDLIAPIFVVEGVGIKKEIETLPEVYHFSVDMLVEEVQALTDLGIHQVILFGIPEIKDSLGSEAYNPQGVVQRAIRAIKTLEPEMYVVTDVCMCQYTDHGHCGILSPMGDVINDATLTYLDKIALSHAEAGADMVAPSDMMDGRIKSMRTCLDKHGHQDVAIMSYAAKFASSFYGPFRAAAHSAPSFGDRKAYQMDPANGREAVLEAQLDVEEGADIIMIKPALSYLDVVANIRRTVSQPIAVYNVSGEYAMIMMAIDHGLVGEEIIMEKLISMKRAGADIIITYFAKRVAKGLRRTYE